MSSHHPSHAIGVLQDPAPIAPSIAAAASAERQLQVLLLSDKAKAPTKGSAFAAGHDLYSARDIVIPARGRARVDTDISISVPVGTCRFFAFYLPTQFSSIANGGAVHTYNHWGANSDKHTQTAA
jgi:hypothetical protein